MKNRMLVHAVWEVARASGNFYGRYRSGEVTDKENEGKKIQRDHVFQKKGIVARLLLNPDSIETEISKSFCCIVTVEEHRRLNDVKELDGWKRYQKANIRVYDMSSGNEINYDQ